jgi:predicted CopG family antitoxin
VNVLTEETDLYELLAKLRDLHLGISEVIHEFIQKKSAVVLADKPSMNTDFDIAKIQWAQSRDSEKGEATWYADANTNKDNVDFKKLWAAIAEVTKAKNTSWFWTKMPEGRGYLWIDQSGSGIYRRLHKKA